MKKIRVAIVGFGNIGRFSMDAVMAADDLELAGIIRRNPERGDIPADIPVVSNIEELHDVDVAILATPSRKVEETAEKILKLGINTVDSFDIHSLVPKTHKNLSRYAAEGNAVSIMSAGWDPGSDSVVRALMMAMVPKGITYTNFGPGMSMGHTVAVKAIEGVKDALSMTIPTGTGIHRRMVYVELLPGYELAEVAHAIKNDPYFASDETHVMQVECVDDYKDMGHGVNLVRKGVSGKTHNQLLEFDMKINNPALTAQILASCARASMRLKPGCYTMIEIPMVDLLPGDRDKWIASLV